ncbi:hypothetical protein HPP92_020031 [Vanilla planifolia]|uniref:AP2/ERF domain-containing protein n=1 Tax=Vanilla planifolia TaxID=51239 RepID=A0A835QDM9_VANPL|nr:hypothetical protein HPP92_020031 [Vanilla planifolia]
MVHKITASRRTSAARKKNCKGDEKAAQVSESAIKGNSMQQAAAQKRYMGVRQSPSGRWVAEIKGTAQKIRLWLGTYDTAETAARVYDEAACLLRGPNTRTNFWNRASLAGGPAPSPKPKSLLPRKVYDHLVQHLNSQRALQNHASPIPPPPLQVVTGYNKFGCVSSNKDDFLGQKKDGKFELLFETNQIRLEEDLSYFYPPLEMAMAMENRSLSTVEYWNMLSSVAQRML